MPYITHDQPDYSYSAQNLYYYEILIPLMKQAGLARIERNLEAFYDATHTLYLQTIFTYKNPDGYEKAFKYARGHIKTPPPGLPSSQIEAYRRRNYTEALPILERIYSEMLRELHTAGLLLNKTRTKTIGYEDINPGGSLK